jgi:hypothetical protein
MQGKGELSEQVKLGLDAVSTVAEGVDICRNLKRPISLPGEPAPPVKAAALTKVGAVAGAVGGFIDFHIAVNSSLKSYYEKGNLLETAANVGVAVTAAVSAGLGLYALLVPAAASGPIGWIALAIGAVGLFLSWLASRLSRDGWEEFAKFCFLGAGCLQGARFGGSDRDLFLGIPSEQFGSTRNLPLQVQSLYGLMAGFYFQTYPAQVHPESYHEAVRGEIRFYPGWTGDKSRVTLYWQFEYGTGYYAYLEVEFSLVHYWGKARVLDTNDQKLKLEDIYIGRPVSDKAGQPGSFFIYPKIANLPSIVDKVTVAVSVMANDYARVPYNKQFEFERRSDNNPGNIRKSSLGNCAGTTYKPRVSQSSTGDRVDGF